MKNHTTFKVGGNASVMIFPKSEAEVSAVIKACKQFGIRLVAIGNGSNLLVSDNGINAAVLCFSNDFSEIRLLDEETVFAESGASLMKLCRFALENSLSGLEFAFGIPGSCGGAAFMNAGAYGGEMKDVLFKCSHIDRNGNAGFLESEDMQLSYRHSAYYENGCIITGIYVKLKKGNKEEIKAKMDDFLQRRKDKQPLEYPSAGSTFKRPEGYFAGALIEECGLKGKAVGGAEVSTKHAGFVINKGNATCADILNLCRLCSETVMKEKGVKLEMEIRVTE
ncbi:MAG: UDP-N-acetylmuramate dehydrogenase [Eubacterium sp.]|nr:UDP-N-acetylmuramate dehydrogenase [Eubacterium sp.]